MACTRKKKRKHFWTRRKNRNRRKQSERKIRRAKEKRSSTFWPILIAMFILLFINAGLLMWAFHEITNVEVNYGKPISVEEVDYEIAAMYAKAWYSEDNEKTIEEINTECRKVVSEALEIEIDDSFIRWVSNYKSCFFYFHVKNTESYYSLKVRSVRIINYFKDGIDYEAFKVTYTTKDSIIDADQP